MAKRNPIVYLEDENGCHICTSHRINQDGYAMCGWGSKGQGLHRAIYEQTYGKLEKGLVVRHLCNNRRCININHLAAGTQAENIQDSVKAKTHYHPEFSGESNSNAILTQRDVQYIHYLRHFKHFTEPKIVKRMNNIVSRQTINDILKGRRWKHEYNLFHAYWIN